MDARSSAAALLARGLPVLRVVPGGKRPVTGHYPNLDARTPEQLEALLQEGDNYGVRTDNLVVIDCDLTDDNDGIKTLALLGIDIWSYGTWWQQTQKGGYHFIFDAGGRFVRTKAGIAPGLDVRAQGGYIVGPGSRGKEGEYICLDLEAEFKPLPDELRALCKPYVKNELPANFTTGFVPGAASVAKAIHYLKHEAPPAVEGNGDNTVYDVASEVIRDHAIPLELANQLMLEHYNPRCDPPWRQDEIETFLRPIRNAHHYATGKKGSKSPDFDFEVIPDPKPQSIIKITYIRERKSYPARPWIVPGILMHKAATLLVAPGGAGKSMFTTDLAVCLLQGDGKPLGLSVVKRKRILLLNNEDGGDEIMKRAAAFCAVHGLPMKDFNDLIAVRDPEQPEVKLFAPNQAGNATLTEEGKALPELIKQEGFDVVILDPLAMMHGMNENSNSEMAQVLALLNMIARKANCSMLVVHHTSKGQQGATQAGSADAARGASAIKDNSRGALTLTTMTEMEAIKHGVNPDLRRRYVRLDDAKQNYASSDGVRWYEMRDVELPIDAHDYNPGAQGNRAFAYVDFESKALDMATAIAEIVVEAFPGTGTHATEGVIAAILERDPMFAVTGEQLEGLFERTVVLPCGKGVRKKQRGRLSVVDTTMHAG